VSGEPAPSDPDRNVTFSLENAGMIIGVHLVDHVIVGHERYFSFREEGLMRLSDPVDGGGVELMPAESRGWIH